MILDDISQAVGNTPLLRLTRFAPDLGGTLLAKLELLNPYSIKDRPVLYMIRGKDRRAAATTPHRRRLRDRQKCGRAARAREQACQQARHG